MLTVCSLGLSIELRYPSPESLSPGPIALQLIFHFHRREQVRSLW
jgi:hypothetical protein